MAVSKKRLSSKVGSKSRTVLVPGVGREPSFLNGVAINSEVHFVGVPLCSYDRGHSAERERDVFAEIAQYEWAIFLDDESVHAFFESFFKNFSDDRCLGPMRVACLSQTAVNTVKGYRYAVDLVEAENLGKELLDTHSLDSSKVLIVGPEGEGDALIKFLETAGHAIVDHLPIYKRVWMDGELKGSQNEAVAIVLSSEAVFYGFLKCADVFASCRQRLLALAANETVAALMKAKKLPVDAVLEEDVSEASVQKALDALG